MTSLLCAYLIIDSRHVVRNGIITQSDDLTITGISSLDAMTHEPHSTRHVNTIVTAEPTDGQEPTLPHPNDIFHPDNITFLAHLCPPIVVGQQCRLRFWSKTIGL